MEPRKPAVFVSSTFYDLAQVRTDLRTFISEMGYEPVLSEYDSFPVNPDTGPVDNCVEVVESRVDLFVLIVGGRLGCVADRGRSITNLEYLAARSQGVPVYAFVRQDIIHILPVWRANRAADFKHVVDDTRLFDFVAELFDSGETWVFPFARAEEIYETLRRQWSYLFTDALLLRKRAARSGLVSLRYNGLSGAAFRLAVERDRSWEYALFAELVREGIANLYDFKRDWQFGLTFGECRDLTIREFLVQMRGKNVEAALMAQNFKRSLDAVMDGFGAPGTPGNMDAIIHGARRYVEAYRSALEWKLGYERIQVPPPAARLKEIASEMLDATVAEIEEFTTKMVSNIQEAVRHPGEPGRQLHLNLRLSGPDLSEFVPEVERLSEMLDRGEIGPND